MVLHGQWANFEAHSCDGGGESLQDEDCENDDDDDDGGVACEENN